MSQTILTSSARVARRNAFFLIGLLLFLLLFLLSLYTLLHEGGHAIMALLFGGKITSFNANFFNLSANVGVEGEFTRAQNALISAAGVSLPLILSMAYLLLSPKTSEPVLGYFRLGLFMVSVNALLAWVAIPLLALSGQTAADDSYNFLNYTGLHPLVVSGAALLIYAGCWALFLRHIGGFQALRNSIIRMKLDLSIPETQRNIHVLAAVGVAIMAGAYALTVALPTQAFSVPEGYETLADFDLSQGPLVDAVVFRMTIDKPATLNFFITMTDVKGGPARIHLVGPNGYDLMFFDDPNQNLEIGRASVNPQGQLLEPGNYELRASFPRSKGRISVSIKSE